MASDLTITIRGAQGAGKSTLAAALAEMLESVGANFAIEEDGDWASLRRIGNPDPRRNATEALKKLIAGVGGMHVNITTEVGDGSRIDVVCETCDAPVGTPCQCAEGACPEHEDGIHCEHWWDGDGCCACAAPAMTEDEKHAQGMED